MLMTADLSSAQQLIVWSARMWVSSTNLQRPVLDKLEQAYAFAGVAEIARDIDELFCTITVGARGDLGFGAPHCPRVHPVEAALINCLSAFQSDVPACASHVLEGMLQPAAARMAVAPAQRWARALSRSGWQLEMINADRFLGKLDTELQYPLMLGFDEEAAAGPPSVDASAGFDRRNSTLH